MGNSPRPDLITDLRMVIPLKIPIIEIGILDGLSTKKVNKMVAKDNNKQIITKIKSGETIILNSVLVKKSINKIILNLELDKDNNDNILIACDENYSFQHIKKKEQIKTIFLPYQILTQSISTIINKKRIAILLPIEGQELTIGKKWLKFSNDCTFFTVNPFEDGQIKNVVSKLKTGNYDFIIMDCFGYTIEQKEYIKREIKIPIISSREVIITIIQYII